MSKGLKLTDILVTVVIALVFGVIYKVWGEVYGIASLPGIQLEQLVYGMWFMAGSVAFLIIRKPGVAFLAEISAALIEMIMFSRFGIEAFTYGLVQAVCLEAVFAAFGYRRYSIFAAGLSGVAAGAGALIYDYFKADLADLRTWNLLIFIGFRFLGAYLICGPLAYAIVKALEKTGVTQLVRPVSSREYDALDRKQRTL